MWRELIGGLFDDAVFKAPAPAEAIVALERELKVAIPDDLKALLGESNGVVARYSTALVPHTSWIYKWDHEDDNREWFATNLEDFFRRIVPQEPSG
jgi:hypothetical protein